MIKNTDVSTLLSRTTELLQKFDQSAFEFFLTGSNFFGGANAESDYDFFTADCDGVRMFLTQLGFNAVDSTYKDNVLINDVFRLSPMREPLHGEDFDSQDDWEEAQEKQPLIPGAEGFDVQLVKPGELGTIIKVQEILKKRYPRGLYGSPENLRETWNLVTHTVKSVLAKPV